MIRLAQIGTVTFMGTYQKVTKVNFYPFHPLLISISATPPATPPATKNQPLLATATLSHANHKTSTNLIPAIKREILFRGSKHDITFNIKVLGDNYGTKTTIYRITTWDLYVVSIMDL